MFLGTFSAKFLGSWQMVLSAKLRSALESDRAIITIGFDKCVYGFSIDDWQKISDQEVLNKPLFSKEGAEIRRRLFAAALEVDLDDQGRFVIPETLRDYAGLKANLVVIGAGDHFEIWDKDEWENLSHSSPS